MTEGVGDLEQRVLRLEGKILKRQDRRLTLLSGLEKLLLPIAIAALGFWVNLAAQEVARGQLALSQAQENRSVLEAKTAIRLKVLETFYEDISGRDPEKQKTALYLLSAVEPELGQTLARAVATNPQTPLPTRRIAEKVANNIELVGPLINYSVVIYFAESDAQQRDRAEDLRRRLTEHAPLTSVSIRPATSDQLRKWVPPKGNEIRYDQLYEKEAAEKLQALLRIVASDRMFKLQATGSQRPRTENVLTVFLVD